MFCLGSHSTNSHSFVSLHFSSEDRTTSQSDQDRLQTESIRKQLADACAERDKLRTEASQAVQQTHTLEQQLKTAEERAKQAGTWCVCVSVLCVMSEVHQMGLVPAKMKAIVMVFGCVDLLVTIFSCMHVFMLSTATYLPLSMSSAAVHTFPSLYLPPPLLCAYSFTPIFSCH